jgi:MmyB-like transcription regulator ligand binding domain
MLSIRPPGAGEMGASENPERSAASVTLAVAPTTRYISCGNIAPCSRHRTFLCVSWDTLEIPLRERNPLFVAARYAPEYPETQLESPELAQALRAIEIILEHHEPYPGFVINRHWDILKTTKGAIRMASFLGGGMHWNMLRQFFDPDDLRAAVANWPDVARDLLRHLHAEIALAPSDRTAKELLEEVLRYPGVPREWRQRNLSVAPTPLLTVVFRKNDRELRFFSAITTFGAPGDVTLDDVRIECAFPADQATAEFCAALR